MVRSISNDALAKLAQKRATEPIMVVGVAWAGGSDTLYSDREIEGNENVRASILEIGALDSILAISQNETSDEVSIRLSDTDGSIKSIIDTNDVHKANVTIWQWFDGLDFNDRFVVFKGKINSPVTWSEGDRSVAFNAVSQLEDTEVGFTLEEGDFPERGLEDLIGKPWPECFGTTVHQKALKIDSVITGSTAESIGLRDFTIPSRIAAIQAIVNYLVELQIFWAFAAGYLAFLGAEQAAQQAQQKQQQFVQQQIQFITQQNELSAILADQVATEKSGITIIGGEKFPQGTPLTLDISGALFSGQFTGTEDNPSRFFAISDSEHPEEKNFPPKIYPFAESFSITQVNNQTSQVYTGNIGGDQAGPFFAQGGASVKIASAEPIRYIVSITPGNVIKVASFVTLTGGERVLLDVPTSRYSVYTENFGTVTATIIEIHDALSKAEPQPWENTIYVTFQSTIGPNPVDIMRYLINRYTEFSIDNASFSRVRANLNNYPMHFCFPGRKNIFTALQELAFQARCAIYLRNGTFFLVYLPATPTSVHTFNESNVQSNTVELGFTETEELITSFNGTWRATGAQEEDNKVFLRYNVAKYGTHKFDFDFYAYSLLDLVVKVMTFWIIRRGNTFKKLSFEAKLDALNVETFDGVTLDFANDYHAYDATVGIVESSEYNSENGTVVFNVWTGVRSGEMEAYDFSHPQTISQALKFPDPIEEASGNAGGGTLNSGAGGNLNRRGPSVTQGGANYSVTYDGVPDPFGLDIFGENRRNSDRGTQKPSDSGDSNPGTPIVGTTGNVSTGTAPPQTPAIIQSAINDSGDLPFWIDIRVTEVLDSQNPGQKTVFATFFKEVTQGTLKGDTDATWNDGTNEAEFDFKWDSEDGHFGAGTAFLED